MVFITIAAYFMIELRTMPMLKKKENARNLISLGIYSSSTLFFLILVFLQETISDENKESYIGIPLIILVSCLILSNYVISMMDTVKSIRKRCTTKRKYGKTRGIGGEN
jgi:L-asparagine transporter-like permease